MPRPAHYDIRGDAEHQGVADEGAACGMGAQHAPLRDERVDAPSIPVLGHPDQAIEAAQPAEFLELLVHGLIRRHGEHPVARIGLVHVPAEDLLAVVVQLNDEGIASLLGRDADVSVVDIRPGERLHVGIAQGGEGAEAEHVTHRREIRTAREVEAVHRHQLVPLEEDDRILGLLELRLELDIVAALQEALVVSPGEEPLEETDVLLDGGVTEPRLVGPVVHAGAGAQEGDIREETLLVEVTPLQIRAPLLQVAADVDHLAPGGVRPPVALAALGEEAVEGVDHVPPPVAALRLGGMRTHQGDEFVAHLLRLGAPALGLEEQGVDGLGDPVELGVDRGGRSPAAAVVGTGDASLLLHVPAGDVHAVADADRSHLPAPFPLDTTTHPRFVSACDAVQKEGGDVLRHASCPPRSEATARRCRSPSPGR